MSDDAAQHEHEANTDAVGTVRKASDAPAGDAERAAPRAKVSAEDLARALGGAANTAAVTAETTDAQSARNFGLKEVRDPDLALGDVILNTRQPNWVCNSFLRRALRTRVVASRRYALTCFKIQISTRTPNKAERPPRGPVGDTRRRGRFVFGNGRVVGRDVARGQEICRRGSKSRVDCAD
jgi:hypothetical protein